MSNFISEQCRYAPPSDVASFKLAFMRNLESRLGKRYQASTRNDRFLSLAYSVMEAMIAQWIATQEAVAARQAKRVYYISMEWLLGRSLQNALINLGLYDTCRAAVSELGMDLADILETENDPGLGNGGLGRLAACFLDSLATLGIPAVGYGLRYEYGLFHQRIIDGRQVEFPDKWLLLPHPWEIVRPEFVLPIHFGGYLEHSGASEEGRPKITWLGSEEELAMPYDIPIPGYRSGMVNTLRLWSARSPDEFNLEYFNHGDYASACNEQVEAENLTRVLYPADTAYVNRELRVKQEYFLVSASIRDIILRFFQEWGVWTMLPEKAAIHLNDTHPALAIPELMRILLDNEGLDWQTAWDICTRTFAYTNHTMLPEALEEWPVSLLERIVPRHLQIIYEINHHFLKDVARRYPGDIDRLRRMSIVAEDGEKRIRMAYLAVVGSHSINGVSALHTRLLGETVLRDFVEFWPERFNNKTNGITPRRWLRLANPALSTLITEAIGEAWVRDVAALRGLEPFAENADFRAAWRAAKLACKQRLADELKRQHRILLPTAALYDVQVKRIHEYKRQLLFALRIIAEYLRLKDGGAAPTTPSVCLFGGKAAPGYERAKLIILLINRIADIVNCDGDLRGMLSVHFLPDYSPSLAERLIPAADVSEQISTAGMEASGTGNMKFALNGAITLGTLDGANVEILEEVGAENIFIFGNTADDISRLKREGYRPGDLIAASPELQRVLHLLACDFFSPGEPGLFRPIYEELTTRDYFCHLADFAAYLACHEQVMQAYADIERWTRMSILNVARCGKFSSDRTIREYVRDIWHADAVTMVEAGG